MTKGLLMGDPCPSVQANHEMTVGILAKEIEMDRLKARKKGNYNAAISASREIGKLYGLYETHNRQRVPTEGMSRKKLDFPLKRRKNIPR